MEVGDGVEARSGSEKQYLPTLAEEDTQRRERLSGLHLPGRSRVSGGHPLLRGGGHLREWG